MFNLKISQFGNFTTEVHSRYQYIQTSVNFHDKKKTKLDHSENYSLCQPKKRLEIYIQRIKRDNQTQFSEYEAFS